MAAPRVLVKPKKRKMKIRIKQGMEIRRVDSVGAKKMAVSKGNEKVHGKKTRGERNTVGAKKMDIARYYASQSESNDVPVQLPRSNSAVFKIKVRRR